MGWNATASISGGTFTDWTPTFNNGTNQFDASQMTYTDCRYTILEGTVYSLANFTLGITSDYGTGTGDWFLWVPAGMKYVDYDTGGRVVGNGWMYNGYGNVARIDIVAVNTFDVIFFPRIVKYKYSGGGNWCGGTLESTPLNRTSLAAVADGHTLYVSWYMTYIAGAY